jgi:hypothetical protein
MKWFIFFVLALLSSPAALADQRGDAPPDLQAAASTIHIQTGPDAIPRKAAQAEAAKADLLKAIAAKDWKATILATSRLMRAGTELEWLKTGGAYPKEIADWYQRFILDDPRFYKWLGGLDATRRQVIFNDCTTEIFKGLVAGGFTVAAARVAVAGVLAANGAPPQLVLAAAGLGGG